MQESGIDFKHFVHKQTLQAAKKWLTIQKPETVCYDLSILKVPASEGNMTFLCPE